MRFISNKSIKKAEKYISEIMLIAESIPLEAFGNSADSIEKMSRIYENMAEIAYILGGIQSMNSCISIFSQRARNIDEMLAISKAHITTVKNHTKEK